MKNNTITIKANVAERFREHCQKEHLDESLVIEKLVKLWLRNQEEEN